MLIFKTLVNFFWMHLIFDLLRLEIYFIDRTLKNMINITLCTMLHIEILYLIDSYEEVFDKFWDKFLKKYSKKVSKVQVLKENKNLQFLVSLFFRSEVFERLLTTQKNWGWQWLLSCILEQFDVKRMIEIGEEQRSTKKHILF